MIDYLTVFALSIGLFSLAVSALLWTMIRLERKSSEVELKKLGERLNRMLEDSREEGRPAEAAAHVTK